MSQRLMQPRIIGHQRSVLADLNAAVRDHPKFDTVSMYGPFYIARRRFSATAEEWVALLPHGNSFAIAVKNCGSERTLLNEIDEQLDCILFDAYVEHVY